MQLPTPPRPDAISEPEPDAREPHALQSLIAFFALAFAWSWACWLLAPAVKVGTPVASTALSLTGGFGPSLAAVVLVAHSSGMAGLRRWLLRCFHWRLGWRWFLLAISFPVVFMGLAATVHVALGGTLPPSPAAGHWGMAALNFLLIFLVGGPLGEELGWRGFALPAMQARWGWRVASLLLGVVWAVWHLPLFFSAGTVQSHLPMGLYALSAVASSVLFAWLFKPQPGQHRSGPGAAHGGECLVPDHPRDGAARCRQPAAVLDRRRHPGADGSCASAQWRTTSRQGGGACLGTSRGMQQEWRVAAHP